MHTNKVEHFCTLFDSNFLPMGMTLHQSLLTHAQPFHLWILCMDELVEQQLEMISLPHVTLIPLRDIETTELLAVKPGRSRGEYCCSSQESRLSRSMLLFRSRRKMPAT